MNVLWRCEPPFYNHVSSQTLSLRDEKQGTGICGLTEKTGICGLTERYVVLFAGLGGNVGSLSQPQTPAGREPIGMGTPDARSGHTCCVVGGRLYLLGGWDRSTFLNDAWMLDRCVRCVSTPLHSTPLPRRNRASHNDRAALRRPPRVV